MNGVQAERTQGELMKTLAPWTIGQGLAVRGSPGLGSGCKLAQHLRQLLCEAAPVSSCSVDCVPFSIKELGVR